MMPVKNGRDSAIQFVPMDSIGIIYQYVGLSELWAILEPYGWGGRPPKYAPVPVRGQGEESPARAGFLEDLLKKRLLGEGSCLALLHGRSHEGQGSVAGDGNQFLAVAKPDQVGRVLIRFAPMTRFLPGVTSKRVGKHRLYSFDQDGMTFAWAVVGNFLLYSAEQKNVVRGLLCSHNDASALVPAGIAAPSVPRKLAETDTMAQMVGFFWIPASSLPGLWETLLKTEDVGDTARIVATPFYNITGHSILEMLDSLKEDAVLILGKNARQTDMDFALFLHTDRPDDLVNTVLHVCRKYNMLFNQQKLGGKTSYIFNRELYGKFVGQVTDHSAPGKRNPGNRLSELELRITLSGRSIVFSNSRALSKEVAPLIINQ